uniref:Uncharacterized protein n=1 Tax=Rhizophora mucronata TaxID=61149 RepID=A0A2P2KCI2_RHIMU
MLLSFLQHDSFFVEVFGCPYVQLEFLIWPWLRVLIMRR